MGRATVARPIFRLPRYNTAARLIMAGAQFASLQNHKYINLATFRKNGQEVRTPVWFAGEPPQGVPEKLYVYSTANSGKAKRIRNNRHVRLAPCDARGKLLGGVDRSACGVSRWSGNTKWHASTKQKVFSLEAGARFLRAFLEGKARRVRDSPSISRGAACCAPAGHDFNWKRGLIPWFCS